MAKGVLFAIIKSFEEKIEQDFVDASLLSDEHDKESEIRGIAQSRFLMMKLESIYLRKVAGCATNLLVVRRKIFA